MGWDEFFGIRKENLKKAKEELIGLLGEERVSDDPAILICYSHDFTPEAGRMPNLVVLPQTTEEVSEIVKIANKYEIPVYVITTGYNHGGMWIPRRGGIMIDLKKMDSVCEIDEESMTATLSPHVRIASLYEESNKRTSVDDIKLRPANPITMGSVSMLSNYVSGGASHIAYKTGNHHENIVGMTWVMPDGSIVKTGTHSYPFRGKIPCLGPGPDVGGIFLASQGSYGICTEITIKLFNEMPKEKLCAISQEDIYSFDLEKISEFFYKAGRENFIHDFYKSGSRHGASVSFAPVVEDVLDMQPVHVVVVTLTGIDDEEIQIKYERLQEIVNSIPGLMLLPDESFELMVQAFNWDIEEAKRCLFKRLWRGNRVMRWRGSFQWVAFPSKFEHIPYLEKKIRDLIARYWIDTNPSLEPSRVPFQVSLQGPFPMSRMIALEFDFWVDHTNPEEVKRTSMLFKKIVEEMIKEGAVVGRTVALSQEIQMPRLGIYHTLVKDIKKKLDPRNIMSPDTLPLGD